MPFLTDEQREALVGAVHSHKLSLKRAAARRNRRGLGQGRTGAPCGTANGHAALDETDIPRILKLISAGESNSSIARRFGVNEATIRRLRNGKTYRADPADRKVDLDTLPKGYVRGEKHPLARLTAESVREIFRLREEGWKQRAIAERVGVSQRRVWDVLNGQAWTHLSGNAEGTDGNRDQDEGSHDQLRREHDRAQKSEDQDNDSDPG